MLKTFAGLAGLTLLTAAAAAQDDKAMKKQMELIADAESSAQTCTQFGYDVDFQGIMDWKAASRDAALANGMDAAAYDEQQQYIYDSKMTWLDAKYQEANQSTRNSASRDRFQRFWKSRCRKLSKDEQTAEFFSS